MSEQDVSLLLLTTHARCLPKVLRTWVCELLPHPDAHLVFWPNFLEVFLGQKHKNDSGDP